MLDLKLDLMRRLLAKNVNKEKIRRLLFFIKGYLRLEEPKNQLIFEQKYDELLNIQQNMGILEIVVKQTREEGRLEGRQEALTEAQEAQRQERKKNVFNMRQKKFSAKSISEILDLPIADVKAFFKELDAEKNQQK